MEGFDMLRVMQFLSVRKLVFGLDAVQEIVKEAKDLGKNALIVTDKVLIKLGVIDKISSLLKNSSLNVEAFDECEAEPRLEIYEKAKDVVREVKPDLVIGIGGGSNMDIAKVTSILATNEGDASEYILLAPRTYERNRLSLIQVPTTAGTGSEVTRYAVVTVKGEKWDFKNPPNLLCDVAIIDPMLTISMPPRLTASTGIDALSHAIESLLSIRADYMTMPYALKSIRLISRFLRRAYSNGEDLEARYHMSLAATYAGISLCNAGTILGHAAAYTFSAQHGLPHGVACSIALPFAMEYNMPLTYDKLAKIGKAMGVGVKGTSLRKSALSTIEAVRDLIKDLDMPTSLREAEVPRSEIEEIVEKLLTKYKLYGECNPREGRKEFLIEMCERMWEGKLESSP